jgi:YD repeat-containing protein
MRGLSLAAVAATVALVVLLAPAAGQARGAPALAWSPATNSSYDYGKLDAHAGQTRSVTFTLTNSGGGASGGLTITRSGSPAFTTTADGCTGRSLGPKKSCSVTVRYAPTTDNESDSATLAGTGESASASITLRGTSVGVTLACPGPAFFGGAVLPDILNGKLACLLTVPGASLTTTGQLQATSPLGADTFTYDQAGHLLRIGDSQGIQTSFGALPGSLLRAGATTSFTYDAAGQVVSSTGSAGTTTFTYDIAGNLVSIHDASGASSAFTYDAAGRLLSERGYDAAGQPVAARGRSFTYNSAGDLVSAGAYSFAYDSAGQVVTSTGPQGTTMFTYDSGGDLVSAGATSFVYDSGGRLISMMSPQGTTTFTYDSAGDLVSATEPNGTTTSFTYR